MIDSLSKDAILAREHAYCKYSSFAVGAAILTKSGKVYTGANIENVSFGATICAERVAIYKAIFDGERDFAAIAIAGGSKDVDFTSPCGICRQVLTEFCDKDFKIILTNGKEDKVFKLGELMPQSFDTIK